MEIDGMEVRWWTFLLLGLAVIVLIAIGLVILNNVFG